MLLAELRRLGLKLTANGERHDVESVALLSDQLRAAIRAHKTALLRELADVVRPRRFPQAMEGATRCGHIGPAVDALIASQELKSKQQPRVPMGRRFHSLTGGMLTAFALACRPPCVNSSRRLCTTCPPLARGTGYPELPRERRSPDWAGRRKPPTDTGQKATCHSDRSRDLIGRVAHRGIIH
jgi:hypothetical protein